MKAVALLLIALWIAGGVGRQVVGRLEILRDVPLERFVYGTALGLATGAYGVFALGLCGLLSFWPVTLWWVLLAVIGGKGMRANAWDCRAWLSEGGFRVQKKTLSIEWTPIEWTLRGTAIGILAFCGLIAVFACFLPPTGRAWDALAYHLADPKIFLAEHRITSLPTEHHSNFPFTMEMLFAVGLLYDHYALANLFHCLTAALTVAAMIAFSGRLWGPIVGYLAAVLFATTPLVLWEATVAYIDLGLGLFLTLSVFAAISAMEAHKRAAHGIWGASEAPETLVDKRAVIQWIGLAGATMGIALGIKYLALLPFTFVGLLLLRRVGLRGVAIYASLALVIAAPWYIKNCVLLRNPVYPYFFGIFPQSRYWSADRAAIYQIEQNGFGYPHAFTSPSEALRNLVQTPWNLLVNARRYANAGDFTFTTFIGGLYAGFGFALAFMRRVPRTVRDLMVLALIQVVAWFFVAQIGRYLVSLLPLLATVGGYSAWRLMRGTDPLWEEAPLVLKDASLRFTPRLLLPLLAIGGQVALLFWGLMALPARGSDVAEVLALGLYPTALSLPQTVVALGKSTPEREAMLIGSSDFYPAMQWINTQPALKREGVILYEETRGFFLDRPYLWGNGEHSAYIPYKWLRDGAALTGWLRSHGIRFLLINLNFSPQKPPSMPIPGDREALEALLRQWYMETDAPPGTWRYLLGDALRRGDWTLRFAYHGVVVLEERPQQASLRKERDEGRVQWRRANVPGTEWLFLDRNGKAGRL